MIAKIFIGALLGGALGYAAYRFVGCGTGSCPLIANPWTSTLYGMLLGGLLGSAFK